MIPEVPPRETEDGLVAVGGGWFVINALDARWFERPGRRSVSFTGRSEYEADTFFPMLGAQLAVLEPGVPSVDEDTQDTDAAYASRPAPEPTRYRDSWLPS